METTLESPLDYKEIQPVHPKGDQSWIFIGRTDAEAPILWPPDAKSSLIGKDPDAGKDWRQEKKDDRGWDSWMASPTQWTWVWVGSRIWWRTGKCCSPWGHKELDMTEWLNWTSTVKNKVFPLGLGTIQGCPCSSHKPVMRGKGEMNLNQQQCAVLSMFFHACFHGYAGCL